MANTIEKLTPKQAMFVIEYLKDLNATQAAIRAGYSENTSSEMGYENLNKPHIVSAIQEQMDARAARTLITADSVIHRLNKLANTALENNLDLSAANKALETLARHLKLLTDRTELGNLDGTNLTPPPIERFYVGKPEEAANG